VFALRFTDKILDPDCHPESLRDSAIYLLVFRATWILLERQHFAGSRKQIRANYGGFQRSRSFFFLFASIKPSAADDALITRKKPRRRYVNSVTDDVHSSLSPAKRWKSEKRNGIGQRARQINIARLVARTLTIDRHSSRMNESPARNHYSRQAVGSKISLSLASIV